MTFPLFRRPGGIVLLDDDPSYLEMMSMILPARWQVALFLRPRACLDHLQQEPTRWEADAWEQQRLIDRWRAGAALIPQILAYWSAQTGRYALTRVCVFDYSMPGMSGLDALGELAEWAGSRILLTGQADEQIAVNAFNQGLIDQFIPKQTTDISRRLVDAIQRLLENAHARHSQTWRATLTPEQHALLGTRSVQRDLTALSNERWIEHVVIGAPFGILGMTTEGHVSWLQLEPTTGLAELAELAETQGLRGPEVAEIRAGRQLVDLELQQALGHSAQARLAPTFPIGSEGALVGALFDVNSPAAETSRRSYAAWLAQQDSRLVRS